MIGDVAQHAVDAKRMRTVARPGSMWMSLARLSSAWWNVRVTSRTIGASLSSPVESTFMRSAMPAVGALAVARASARFSAPARERARDVDAEHEAQLIGEDALERVVDGDDELAASSPSGARGLVAAQFGRDAREDFGGDLALVEVDEGHALVLGDSAGEGGFVDEAELEECVGQCQRAVALVGHRFSQLGFRQEPGGDEHVAEGMGQVRWAVRGGATADGGGVAYKMAPRRRIRRRQQ
jgi:hypothetical protein